MIQKKTLNTAFGFLKLKCKHRKIIHYTLLVSVFLLQIIGIVIWSNEASSELETSKALYSMDYQNRVSAFTNKVSRSFIDSQRNFNDYAATRNKAAFDKYAASLKEISRLIDSLRLISKENREFEQILMKKKHSESHVKALKTKIDSILNLRHSLEQSKVSSLLKLQKFEYRNILDSIKTERYAKLDSVSKKSLFGRLKAALAGKTDVQTEHVYLSVMMKYKDEIVSGGIEDQILKLLDKTNSHYEQQFENLKKTFADLKNHDARLMQLNEKLLDLEGEIMPAYARSLNILHDSAQRELQKQHDTSKAVRSYALPIFRILMIVILLAIFYVTRAAFQYEKQLTAKEVQITESLNFKNRIMGMISHEIRSPLSIICVYSKMIGSSIKEPEVKEAFQSIQFTANSLLLLANQILEYSKDESQLLKLNSSRFHLRSEVGQIIASMSSLLECKENRLEVVSDLGDYEVFSDAVKIHQLFYNIVGNANKFTQNGVIAIDLKAEKMQNDRISLQVGIRDNGCGISESDLKNIFELYYQGTVSRKVNDLGVGLGLNLCKEIIESFGGAITVQSGEGSGTQVSFNLILSLA